MKFPARLALGLALALTIATAPACSSLKKKGSEAELEGEAGAQGSDSPTPPTALSRTEALLRARQIAHVTYNLWFGLDANHNDFEGRAVVNFDLRPQAKDLSKTLAMDFEEGTIRSLVLNGQALVPADHFDGHKITFKTGELRAGSNRVEIAFTHDYGSNGVGMHRFKDPVDGNVYLYSDFEPYDAHRMFPCFDQPDLKASFELTVEAPEEWQIISSTPERDVATVDGRKSWQFPPSPLFSTYVFSLHAGPYAIWKDDANGIPLRLFARQSVKQYVDDKEWMEVTKQGLDYYAVQFGYPYPYAKYDQVIVPDFPAGAMENVGAVTFNERMIFRSKATQDKHRGRATTILHEMAHMWFGDLVTMRWWNGLWLNESFATYASNKAVEEATKFKGTWQYFFHSEKASAYKEDQRVTTHPIEVPVHDTDQALTNFDRITYGKGASVLKQLHYLLGEDDFREGLQRYFQKYALRNTTVTDFVKTLQEASAKDLSKWQKSWLQTSGVNTVRAEWACGGDGKISSFKLLQTEPEEGTKELRSHRTEVALFTMKQGKLKPTKSFAVTYSSASTSLDEAVGSPCPVFVYPNYNDYDYAKVELDPLSLETAKNNLAKIEDPLLRQMLWHALWEMVVDGKIPAQKFIETVLAQLEHETNTVILSTVLHSVLSTSQDKAFALKYLTGETREKFADRIEKFSHDQLKKAPAGSDLQLIWFKAFLEAAHSNDALKFARALLDGKSKISGLKVDQERRWELIQSLARGGIADAQALIDQELKLDNTDMGQKAAIVASVSIPTAESKKMWLDKILNRSMPYPKLREAMESFHVFGQEELSRMAIAPYFEMLPKLSTLKNESYMRRFASAMYPALCDSAVIGHATAALKSPLPVAVVKSLKVGRQEDERCIRGRDKASH